MSNETLEQEILAAEDKYRSTVNMTDYWLMYSAVVDRKNILKAELAEKTAKWLCGHPYYDVNSLINLFVLVHGKPNEIEAVLRYLAPFLPDENKP